MTGATVALYVLCLGLPVNQPAGAADPLTIEEARVCVTGHDHNRPDPFPGLGDFIGWPGGIERMPNGDLLVSHSAGYWHASFAEPLWSLSRLRLRPMIDDPGPLDQTPGWFKYLSVTPPAVECKGITSGKSRSNVKRRKSNRTTTPTEDVE